MYTCMGCHHVFSRTDERVSQCFDVRDWDKQCNIKETLNPLNTEAGLYNTPPDSSTVLPISSVALS